jgi:alcohol dehydrogenase class IV
LDRAYLEYFVGPRPERWEKLAGRVFGVMEGDEIKAVQELNGAVIAWLKKIGMHMRFSDINRGSEKFERMADTIIRIGDQEGAKVPGPRPMGRSDILELLSSE